MIFVAGNHIVRNHRIPQQYSHRLRYFVRASLDRSRQYGGILLCRSEARQKQGGGANPSMT